MSTLRLENIRRWCVGRLGTRKEKHPRKPKDVFVFRVTRFFYKSWLTRLYFFTYFYHLLTKTTSSYKRFHKSSMTENDIQPVSPLRHRHISCRRSVSPTATCISPSPSVYQFYELYELSSHTNPWIIHRVLWDLNVSWNNNSLSSHRCKSRQGEQQRHKNKLQQS